MRYTVLLILIFLSLAASLQAQPFNFRNYFQNDGLPDLAVAALCEDSRGFLWVGTESGLFRFDGYTFESIPIVGLSRSVSSIYQRRDGTLCIGTSRGLIVYNGNAMHVVDGMANKPITSFAEDSRNVLWVGTSEGLYRQNGESFTLFTSGRKDNPGRYIHSLIADDHALWIASNEGVARYDGQQFRLFTEKDGLPSNDVRSVLSTKDRILFATSRGLYNANTREQITSKEALTAIAGTDDEVWFGGESGLSVLKGGRIELSILGARQGDNSVTTIHRGPSGTLWVGTRSQGLFKLQSQRFAMYTSNDQMGKSVFSVATSLNGNIMCGSSLGGVTIFDGRNFSRIDKSQGFSSSVATCFHYTPDSTLWVGTSDDGLFRFTKTKVEQITTEDHLPSNSITSLAHDKNGNLWVGTLSNGVVIMDLQGDSIKQINILDSLSDLRSNRITLITPYEDKLYIGTEDNGLAIVQMSDTIPPRLLRVGSNANAGANQINGIAFDQSGKGYIATGAGVGVIEGNTIRFFLQQHDLSSDRVFAIAFDSEGHLWAATDRGLDRISSLTASSPDVTHFGNDEGYSGGEVYRSAVTMDNRGDLWFGTMNGLVKYRKLNSEARSPLVHIIGLKLFFDDVATTEFADTLGSWFKLPLSLELPYDQNNLTFSYTGLYHSNQNAVEYKWRLRDFNDEWSPPMKDRQAVFSNLPPGRYTFEVMARNEFNKWSSPASYEFVINPHWWQLWWVRSVAIAALLLGIWGTFHLRIRQIRTKNRLIQERLEMEKNILELEQEAAKLQMNPHFIFNCLNSIQGLISMGKSEEARSYLAKFGKLMRLILENSREEFVPMEKELSILDNYLQLEQMTTSFGFSFNIHVDPQIDPAVYEIPPMLVQPFIENAIIHGLKHKASAGQIDVEFTLRGKVMHCIVTDNGVGRVKAAEWNKEKRANHKSTAISVTRQRLEQYGSTQQISTGVEFIDLTENGMATGTQVIIRMPYFADEASIN